jgi:hypothetical protein
MEGWNDFEQQQCLGTVLPISEGNIPEKHWYDWYTRGHLLLGAAKIFKVFREINLILTDSLMDVICKINFERRDSSKIHKEKAAALSA